MKQKVKMLTSMAGADFNYAPGQIIEVDSEIARAWHDAHLAEIVKEEEQKPAAKTKEKAGEDDGSETDNAASKRTGKRK